MDICKRNGKNKLIWFGDKEKTLNYSPKSGEMILTVHRWFANKSCPGNWMYARMGELANKVTAQLGGSTGQKTEEKIKTGGTQASVLKALSEADAIKDQEGRCSVHGGHEEIRHPGIGIAGTVHSGIRIREI